MRVTRLDGALLDYWVAKSAGLTLHDAPEEGDVNLHDGGFWHPSVYHPSSNWAQGGPIVSNEWHDLEQVLNEWFGPSWPFVKSITDEPLKWLMRAYVATHFGEEVEEVAGIESSAPTPLAVAESPAPATSRKWSSWFLGG